jgi:hypothetical protein
MPGLGRGPPGPAAPPGRGRGGIWPGPPGRGAVGRAEPLPTLYGLFAMRGLGGPGDGVGVAGAVGASAAAAGTSGAAGGATGSATGAGCGSGTGTGAAAVSGAGAASAAAFLAGALRAGFWVGVGNASRTWRSTGASTVDDADFTYSPISCSLASTSLLVTPSSFASADTRALPGT